MKRRKEEECPISLEMNPTKRRKIRNIVNRNFWKWKPFSNSARGIQDKLRLNHWRKDSEFSKKGTRRGDLEYEEEYDEEEEEEFVQEEGENEDYEYSIFGKKKTNILTYTSVEYEMYVSPLQPPVIEEQLDEDELMELDCKWDKDQTDLLFSLLKKYDFNFVVVHDRFPSKYKKSLELVKKRYFDVTHCLIKAKKLGTEQIKSISGMENFVQFPIRTVLLNSAKKKSKKKSVILPPSISSNLPVYDFSNEVKRKMALKKFYERPPEDEKMELFLRERFQVIRNEKEEMEKKENEIEKFEKSSNEMNSIKELRATEMDLQFCDNKQKGSIFSRSNMIAEDLEKISSLLTWKELVKFQLHDFIMNGIPYHSANVMKKVALVLEKVTQYLELKKLIDQENEEVIIVPTTPSVLNL